MCVQFDRQAFDLRMGQGGRGIAEPMVWGKRAVLCPHAPEVLVLAAQDELLEVSRLSWDSNLDGTLDELVAEHRERLTTALGWLNAAVAESQRRGELAPLETYYQRAHLLFALGRYEEVGSDLDRARALGEVRRWRIDRMAAMVELLLGDLHRAVELGRLAWTDAPPDERAVSGYLWALILDRVGATEQAERVLHAMRRDSGHLVARQAVRSLLPIHERLYLAALDQQADGEGASALRLWHAYLARPEPVEADRELARRHVEALANRPVPVGGPLR